VSLGPACTHFAFVQAFRRETQRLIMLCMFLVKFLFIVFGSLFYAYCFCSGFQKRNTTFDQALSVSRQVFVQGSLALFVRILLWFRHPEEKRCK